GTLSPGDRTAGSSHVGGCRPRAVSSCRIARMTGRFIARAPTVDRPAGVSGTTRSPSHPKWAPPALDRGLKICPSPPLSGGIAGRLLRPLAERTRHAGQGEILFGGRAAGRPRNDVVDVERGLLPKLGQSAVLAPVAGPEEYKFGQLAGDVTHPATRSARSRR